jgi:predicted CXXCH cytochrome family protein
VSFAACRRRLPALGAALLAAALAAEISGRRPARAGPEPATDGIVGAEACRPCHEKEHAEWAASVHATTLEPASAANLPEVVAKGGTAEHPPGKTIFRPRDGAFLAETLGPDGKPHEYPVTHVVGRMRIRMYLSTLDDGRLQVLPFMREEGTGRFFDYTHLIFGAPGGASNPDEPPVVGPKDASFWTGVERSFDSRCIRCHVSGHVARLPAPDGKPSRSTWRALGVDCESCHGPGEGHVKFQTGADDRPAKDPMAALRSYTREQSLATCNVCHMEAELLQPGFRPGEDVFEHVTPLLLDDPEQTDPSGRPLELVYAGIPFSVSACAIAGKMTCLECHTPHGGPHASSLKRPPLDDAHCTSCHADVAAKGREHTRHDPKGAGARCVSCHMPHLRIERGHGFVSDHTIGVPRPDAPGDRVTVDACTWCHSGASGAPPGAPALPAERIRASYREGWPHAKPVRPWVAAIAAARSGDSTADRALGAVAKDVSVPSLARATAAYLLGRYPATGEADLLRLAKDPDSMVRRSALRALAAVDGEAVDAALLAALSDASVPVRVAAARAALEGWERVQGNRRLLDAVLPVLAADADAVPEDDERWFRLGAARDLVGDVAGAIAAYERKAALDPYADLVRERIRALRKP